MTVLDKKLSRIERGAYWFGILGRLSIFWGVLFIVSSTFLLAVGAWRDPNSEMYSQMVSGLTGGHCAFYCDRSCRQGYAATGHLALSFLA